MDTRARPPDTASLPSARSSGTSWAAAAAAAGNRSRRRAWARHCRACCTGTCRHSPGDTGTAARSGRRCPIEPRPRTGEARDGPERSLDPAPDPALGPARDPAPGPARTRRGDHRHLHRCLHRRRHRPAPCRVPSRRHRHCDCPTSRRMPSPRGSVATRVAWASFVGNIRSARRPGESSALSPHGAAPLATTLAGPSQRTEATVDLAATA
jgi:hypothetical protein